MTAQRDCHDCRSFVYCAEHSVQKSTSADPCLDAALRKLDALQAMHDAFVAEMGRQHADCEAKREAAERERDKHAACLTELQRLVDAYTDVPAAAAREKELTARLSTTKVQIKTLRQTLAVVFDSLDGGDPGHALAVLRTALDTAKADGFVW